MPRRANNVQTPAPDLERRLRHLQRRISKGTVEIGIAMPQRNELARVLFDEHGYTQKQIADLISAEARAVGDKELGEDTVQNALRRTKR